MRFKSGVVIYKMHERIEELLDGTVLDDTFLKHVGRQCLVTSGREGKHGKNSLHYWGRAIDIRTNDLPNAQTHDIFFELKKELDDLYDILWEYVGTRHEHIHIEYDPH